MILAQLALAMPLSRRLFPLIIAIVVAATIVEMIRRRKLREEFALLWLLACVPLLVFAVFPWTLLALQDLLQTHYLTIVVLLGLGFFAMIILHLSAVLSRRTDDVRRLTQAVALLEEQLRALRKQDAGDSDGDASPPASPDAPS